MKKVNDSEYDLLAHVPKSIKNLPDPPADVAREAARARSKALFNDAMMSKVRLDSIHNGFSDFEYLQSLLRQRASLERYIKALERFDCDLHVLLCKFSDRVCDIVLDSSEASERS